MRTQARKIAFQIIFADLFENSDCQKTLNELLAEEDPNQKISDFVNQILTAYTQNKTAILKELDGKIAGYELDRVYKVDLALIYLAITEIKFVGTPKAVVINEILEIAKIFSAEKSVSFINGVLAKLD